ncbi:mechanosensitive ion channel [Sulfurimonas aquatica]|uniref:Mechanosensitive ion channel n=1 Tax=Sulfurimonas aquatica TaxID=2672570 RepID=A0A975B2A3_9BACT|nr:mechanosensitive ion channel domain-containing protein [Sulfurimonas aquatica]QSZ42916.1 mechanosensitive ion channel [Sulfurimonas aquatica]
MIYKLIILLSFMTLSLYAAQLDSKIIDADNSTLEALYKQVEMKKQTDSDTLLQKVLIKKLESFDTEYKVNGDVNTTITGEVEYRKLLKNYYLNMQELFVAKASLENTEHTLLLLQENLESSDKVESILTQQLQYAYHKKKLLYSKNKVAGLQKAVDTQKELISSNLMRIKIDKKSLENDLSISYTSEKKLLELITKLKLEKEKFQLLDNLKETNDVIAMIETEQKKLQEVKEKQLAQKFLYFTLYLQQKNEKVFDIQTEIKTILNQMLLSPEFKNSVLNFINSLSSEHMGVLTTITASTNQSIQESITDLLNMLNKTLFSINDVEISFLKLMVAVLIFVFGFYLGGSYKKYIRFVSTKSEVISGSTTILLSNLGYYIIVIIGLFISLNTLGINLSSVALIAGALSVGIGFGLQNIVSNFISGLILMFEKSVKIHDYVELSDTLRGRITDIRMRSTVITTNANIDVIVPNQNFIQNNVVNWTMNDSIKRFDMHFGVAYGADIKQVIQVIEDAVKNSTFSDVYVSKERVTRVLMTGMGDSSVNFTLNVWIKGNEIFNPKRTESRFLILIYEALYEHNITIPFPQLDLHIKKDEESPINV